MRAISLRVVAILLIAALFTACGPAHADQPSIPSSTPTGTFTLIPASETSTPELTPTVVEGTSPSYKVAAFYYPWYGNPITDGKWIHWTQNNHVPPEDISSDYFPALEAYSSNDPEVVAQHMEWLRQAGMGVIITSWWGQGSREDQAVPLLLQTAEGYGVKVAFHIEPYDGRTPESLVSDIKYLYDRYSNSPAFFRSVETSRYSPLNQPKGMFFVWSIQDQGTQDFLYWQKALDEIHALPESGLVIANSLQSAWIKGSHFDGLYNYASLHLEKTDGFRWARGLPPDSLYVPSVIPGFSAKRVGYADTTYVAREEGSTFDQQWTSALETGIVPAMVTVTSFNEWHEGSMIEPPQFGVSDGHGYTYADFGSLPAEGYLTLTHDWIAKYLAMTWPATYRTQIKISTTSDWTTVDIVNGGAWIRPELMTTTGSVTQAGMEAGDRFILTQSLADANAGKEIEMTWDVLLTDLVSGHDLTLQIDRGNLGKTRVTVSNYVGATPVEVKTLEWDQVTTDRNSLQVVLPAESLMDSGR